MTDPTVAILELLAGRRGASRSELAEVTGMSSATVGRTVDRLRRDGFVREVPLAAKGVGRPPRIVELSDRAGYVVGIDAGGRTLRAALADFQGRILRRIARPTNPDSRDALVRDLVAIVGSLAASAAPGHVLAVAAGISGIVDHFGGRVLLAPDLPALAGFDLAAALSEQLRMDVAIDNDDLLAAVGEAAAGAAVGCRDVVFLSIGYGLGAGLIVDGRPVHGTSHAAGAIGFLGPGRLEDRASGRAIPLLYRDALANRGAGNVAPGVAGARELVTDARQVFELAASGDVVAGEVVASVIGDLGELVVSVAALLDPDVIVLGGGLAEAGAALFEPLERRLREALPYRPRLVPSALEDAAVLYGASSVALALARRALSGQVRRGRADVERPTLSLL